MNPNSANRSTNTRAGARVAPELHYCAESDILFIDLPTGSEPITCLQPIRLTAAARISPDGRIVGLMLRSLSQMVNQRVSHSEVVCDRSSGRHRT